MSVSQTLSGGGVDKASCDLHLRSFSQFEARETSGLTVESFWLKPPLMKGTWTNVVCHLAYHPDSNLVSRGRRGELVACRMFA